MAEVLEHWGKINDRQLENQTNDKMRQLLTSEKKKACAGKEKVVAMR